MGHPKKETVKKWLGQEYQIAFIYICKNACQLLIIQSPSTFHLHYYVTITAIAIFGCIFGTKYIKYSIMLFYIASQTKYHMMLCYITSLVALHWTFSRYYRLFSFLFYGQQSFEWIVLLLFLLSFLLLMAMISGNCIIH